MENLMITSLDKTIAFISMPGGWEWIAILIVALLIFGKRLPDVARGMGKSISEFKKGMKEVDDTKNDIVNETKNALNDEDDDKKKQ